jgi:hypothetical protein
MVEKAKICSQSVNTFCVKDHIQYILNEPYTGILPCFWSCITNGGDLRSWTIEQTVQAYVYLKSVVSNVVLDRAGDGIFCFSLIPGISKNGY